MFFFLYNLTLRIIINRQESPANVTDNFNTSSPPVLPWDIRARRPLPIICTAGLCSPVSPEVAPDGL